jgi:DNA-binding transcriptional LysR family regulator
MTPTLPDLRAFVTVAQLRSFAAAAKALHLSQPALSRRISRLEDMLAVRLFDRTTRSVELTTVGREFLRQVRATLEQLDQSLAGLRDVAQLAAGEVTVGCVFSAVHHFLPAVIRTYRERHPQVQVRIIEEGADEVLACVVQGEADFGLNYIGMQEPGLDFLPLLQEPFVLACRADHPLARRREVPWSEVGEYDHVRVSKASRNRLFIDQALAKMPPLPRPVCEVRHVSTLIGMVDAGLGLAVVPQLTLPAQPASVVGVRLVQPEVTRTIGLIHRSGRTLSPAAAAFVQLLRKAQPLRARRRRTAA